MGGYGTLAAISKRVPKSGEERPLSSSVQSVKAGSRSAIFEALANFHRRRWLIRYFLQRQIIRDYQRSFLGFAWAFLGPLMMIGLLTLVFSEAVGLRFRVIEGREGLNFGLYLFCGLLPFLAYSESLSKSVNSIRASAGLIQKVMFPMEFLPFTTAVASLIDKLFGLVALLAMVLVLQHGLEWTILLLPIILVPQLLFILGLSYLMAVVGTFLPDVREIMRAVVRATFFVTPIIWPEDRVPETSALRPLIDYNPLAYLVDAYRGLILFGELPEIGPTILFSVFAALVFVLGFVLFVRLKSRFVDLL